MDADRLYQGISGEIVRYFIRFETFIVMIPMALAWLGLALLSYLLKNNLYNFYINLYIAKYILPYFQYFLTLVSIFLLAIFTGRFAIAARRGDYHCGFSSHKLYSGELLPYAARYIIYNLFWYIPALLTSYYLFRCSNILQLFFLLKFGSSLGSGVDIWYAFLIVLVFFGPLIASLLTIYTESFSEIVTVEPWKWLLFSRAADLPAYMGQVIGGIVLFIMKYFLPFFVLKTVLFHISLKMELSLNEAFGFLPIIIFPILIGRLSGAFVAMDDEESDLVGGQEIKDKSNAAVEQKKIYEHLLQTIEELSPAEMESIEKKAETEEPNIYQALTLSYLYRKTKDQEQSLLQAKKTISQCLDKGMDYEAAQLFRYYIKEKTALNLAPQQLLQLANSFTLQNAYADVAWCYMMAIIEVPEAEKLAIQKRFLSVANTARQHGAHKVANSLFTLFCQQFPDSSLTEFARQQIDKDINLS